MMIATASEASAAHQAFILTPPRRTNSVTSGSTAKSADHPSEFPTGSSTCLYMWDSLPWLLSVRVPGAFERKRTSLDPRAGSSLRGPSARKLGSGPNPDKHELDECLHPLLVQRLLGRTS